jgi:hypothetical protein
VFLGVPSSHSKTKRKIYFMAPFSNKYANIAFAFGITVVAVVVAVSIVTFKQTKEGEMKATLNLKKA